MRCETRLTTLVELTRTNYLLFGSPGLSGENLLIEQRLLRSVRKVKKNLSIVSSSHFCRFSSRVPKNIVSYWIFWLLFLLFKITVRIVTAVLFLSGTFLISKWLFWHKSLEMKLQHFRDVFLFKYHGFYIYYCVCLSCRVVMRFRKKWTELGFNRSRGNLADSGRTSFQM